ncbi:hypothetical protein BS47DRAFT_1366203 [Hydnum rufescens UP504]|uniref:Uncharacterized protein n=1 Tax=Hydnum rufescens UP504 TaxID=1448309 RepID=A0A9P6ALM0_9AGAM|nr:hypothetical protein BS47DRAFT_1366203 [Hydnum rufescens UP504]
MVGTVFRYPLPHNLVAIQTILSRLESRGVPIFGVEELRDHVCYDVYGTKQCRDTVLGTSNPAAVPKPHRISVEMLPHHPIIRPPVWIVKSTGPNKLHRLTNYLDEDAYLNLIQWRSRDALRFRFSGLFSVEALHHPPLQPSNYSDIPPPPTPPTVPEFSHAGPLAMSDDDDEVSTGDELEALWKQMQNDENGVRRKGVIRQKMDESDEAFEARKVEAEGKSAAEKDAAAKYIQKARGGDLDVFHDIRKWIKLSSQGEETLQRVFDHHVENSVEEHSQGDAEAPRREEGAQILPPENDHCTEGACQSAEENRQPTEEENHRPTEEENYQSMDGGNHRPVEEENH